MEYIHSIIRMHFCNQTGRLSFFGAVVQKYLFLMPQHTNLQRPWESSSSQLSDALLVNDRCFFRFNCEKARKQYALIYTESEVILEHQRFVFQKPHKTTRRHESAPDKEPQYLWILKGDMAICTYGYDSQRSRNRTEDHQGLEVQLQRFDKSIFI